MKVLVCSGNLGNAEPDEKSMESWIPKDGSCGQVVLDHPTYPIHPQPCVMSNNSKKAGGEGVVIPETTNDGNGTDTNETREEEAFDLIVLGLQESTFEPKNSKKEGNKKQGDPHLPVEEEEEEIVSPRTSISESVHSAARKAAKATTKVNQNIRSVTTLAANRDHTHKKEAIGQLLPDGTFVLHQQLQRRLPSYTRLLSFQRGEMRLLVYARTSHSSSPQIKVKSVRAKNTGKGGLANKGGIVAQVDVIKGAGTTTLSFVTCHLEAHEGIPKYKARCATMADIFKGTTTAQSQSSSAAAAAVTTIYPDVSLASHVCFVLGDLNFRTRYQGHVHYEDQIAAVTRLVDDQNWTELNQADELQKALENQDCLVGFQTLACHFPPTFKVERQDGYVYKTNRTPSYTDRILWRSGNLLHQNIQPLCYEPIDDFTTSDHKPIRGAFNVQLNDGFALAPRSKHHTRASNFCKRMPGTANVDSENLHLFLSDMQCDIFPGAFAAKSPPDSYLCLVSSPGELLLSSPSLWQRCNRALHKYSGIILHDSDDHADELSQWPRTPVINNTFNPNWEEHEIHCKLKAHSEDGSPIHLGGAILHLFAFRSNIGRDDEVIGSFQVNLEFLFRLCAKDAEGNSLDDGSAHTNLGEKMLHSGITMHTIASDKMVSLDINGPLLKDGRQTGVVRCTLDAWWVEDGLAQAAKAHSLAMGLSSNDAHVTQSARAPWCCRWKKE